MSVTRDCDLCGLGCGKYPIRQRVATDERVFCCAGCMNVYLILSESGAIKDGQDIRQTELFQRSLKLGLISNRGEASTAASPDPPCANDQSGKELLLHVSGMWCTSCAWLIEHALQNISGVGKTEVSFASDLVKVQYRPQAIPPERIIERIERLGYKAQPYADADDENDAQRRDLIIRTGLAAFLWANVMSFSLALYAGYFEQISSSVRQGLPFLLMALSTPVVFYCAQPILHLAWRGLLNRTISMESLLALGILAAYGYSVVQAFRGEIHLYFDTATVIVMLVLAGKLIERGAKQKVSRWIAQLHRMMPNKVRLLVKGVERFVSVDALEPGQIFVVKAGERIPADGAVTEGESHADESLLTGESTPVGKIAGSAVAAGSINLDGVLHIQATKSAGESTLSRIIALVEQGLSTRSDLERTVDRASRIFVPCVVVIAAFTFLFAWWSGSELAPALMRSITVLVIACPCALGLATPLAMTAAFGAASRRGILVQDGRVLETLRKVDTVILDKTGTVTDGTFSLLEIVPVAHAAEHEVLVGAAAGYPPRHSSLSFGGNATETLSLFASLEQYSEHPLVNAVVTFARKQGAAMSDGSEISIRKGLGITGIVEGRNVFAGNRRLAEELGVAVTETAAEQASTLASEGKTVVFIGWDGELQSLAAFGDQLRPEARELAAALKQRNLEVLLISGDARATTQSIATSLGVDSFQAEVLPEEKAEVVRRLQERGAVVAMVGDGINDAPALAQADLGIAMGSGTDIAIKAAAVVLMNSSLRKILDVFDLSQMTMRVVRQNLFWAFFYNSIGITLAVAGLLNPIMAATAMLLSSASVVANSMRLARRTELA